MPKKYFLMYFICLIFQACSNTPAQDIPYYTSGNCGHQCSQAFLLGTRPTVTKTPDTNCGADCSGAFQLGARRTRGD